MQKKIQNKRREEQDEAKNELTSPPQTNVLVCLLLHVRVKFLVAFF